MTLQQAASLRSGQLLSLSGRVYTARDAAHKKMMEALATGEKLPFELAGETIYYVGPCPPGPGQIIGSAGPTTSGRMDPYTPQLLALGLRGMIGKGKRSPQVIEAIRSAGAVYLGATGGAGALLAQKIVSVENIAYPELGPEAVRRLELHDFPAIVIIDSQGRDLYADGRKTWQKKLSEADGPYQNRRKAPCFSYGDWASHTGLSR